MAKATIEEQEALIKEGRKNVHYDTKEFTLELLHSKFNRNIEDSNIKEISIPFYQRNFVWNEKEQSRFIESILLGLPISTMVFAEVENGTLEIIDGSQRMRTIDNFLNNNLKLKGLEKLKRLNKLSFNDFSSSRKRKIRNSTVRAIVLFDLDKDNMDITHELFDRLNTGGKQLTKMEIIKGSQQGEFINFVFEECAKNSKLNQFSNFSNQDKSRGYREEFLIKYFAFSDSLEFNSTLNEYLDNYIDEQNELFKEDDYKDKQLTQFKQMLSFIERKNLIQDISNNRKNRLLAIYVGVTLALREKPSIDKDIDLFVEQFIENAKSSSFQKLRENIQLVKNIILS